MISICCVKFDVDADFALPEFGGEPLTLAHVHVHVLRYRRPPALRRRDHAPGGESRTAPACGGSSCRRGHGPFGLEDTRRAREAAGGVPAPSSPRCFAAGPRSSRWPSCGRAGPASPCLPVRTASRSPSTPLWSSTAPPRRRLFRRGGGRGGGGTGLSARKRSARRCARPAPSRGDGRPEARLWFLPGGQDSAPGCGRPTRTPSCAAGRAVPRAARGTTRASASARTPRRSTSCGSATRRARSLLRGGARPRRRGLGGAPALRARLARRPARPGSRPRRPARSTSTRRRRLWRARTPALSDGCAPGSSPSAAHARKRLLEAMDGERYFQLLDALEGAAQRTRRRGADAARGDRRRGIPAAPEGGRRYTTSHGRRAPRRPDRDQARALRGRARRAG